MKSLLHTSSNAIGAGTRLDSKYIDNCSCFGTGYYVVLFGELDFVQTASLRFHSSNSNAWRLENEFSKTQASIW